MKKSILILILFIVASCTKEDTFTPASEASLRELFSGISFTHSDTNYTIAVDSVKEFTYAEMPVTEFSDSTVYAKSVFILYTKAAGLTSQINIYYFDDADANQAVTLDRMGKGVALDVQRWLPDSTWKPSGKWFLINRPYVMFQETSSSIPAYLEAQRAFLGMEW